MVLKLNLEKAFDKVNWTYLRLILLQIWVRLGGVNWIMGCISMVTIVIMVNGTRSSFFTATRGIRKGYPLSPLLFILVIEGLSLLIKDAKVKGKIWGIKISDSLYLTHLLFVDDVILFGNCTVMEWMAFDVLLETFCYASGMSISLNKSSFLYNELDLGILHDNQCFLPFKAEPIQPGFK